MEPAKLTTPKKEYKPDNYSDMQSHKNSILKTHHRNSESKISMVKHPYIGIKCCKLCQELAVAEIEPCHDSFCLNCMAVLTAQLPDDHRYFSCIDDCKSWISLEALEAFYKRPCAKQLEAPIYFQIKNDVCGNCKGDGIIRARHCNHSLCLDCLQKCKPDEKCQTTNCNSRKLPPKYHFDFLISSLCSEKLDKASRKDETMSLVIDNVSRSHKNTMRHEKYNQQSSSCPEAKSTDSGDLKGKRKLEKDKEIQDERQSKEKIARKPGSRGLRNIGFSCYRNSILQILAETPHFLELLGKSSSEKKKEWIILLQFILEGIRNNITEEIEEQLYEFHHEFNKLNPEYREYEQEDCLSFLTSLLNGIQDALTEQRGTSKDPVHVFRGKWRDKYGCQNCSKVEYFNDSDFFYLPLPYAEKKNKEATIGSCFLGLLKEEEIDIFPCSECGSQKITKQLEIVQFPTILVLQFSKIQEVDLSQQECSFEKRRNFVRFWDNFDGLTNAELKRKIGDDTLRPYRLFGVVVHWGSEKSGHYISYVKIKGELKWKRCDDSYVDDISLKSVLKCNAYLLFYENCESEIN
ncbi:ubiquitin carboxyl-terminal hydrolase 17-like protein D [Saccostrea echinata]|uniref:ubiquitin carboxyl-terminal hydrolase 17-like protein D n=1 Tax=Saccostrea echinata TaxID=191078 RepID=UPI002A82CBAD|nr:ubiquitin carboxyl-terminal hydrolase 17-like protein D [Saccostrea echinata]